MPATAVGEREGQVDGSIEQALAGKVVAHQDPGHDHAEHGIDQGGSGRGEEAHFQRRQHAGRGGDPPDPVEAEPLARQTSTASGISTISDR